VSDDQPSESAFCEPSDCKGKFGVSPSFMKGKNTMIGWDELIYDANKMMQCPKCHCNNINAIEHFHCMYGEHISEIEIYCRNCDEKTFGWNKRKIVEDWNKHCQERSTKPWVQQCLQFDD
jgi:hypothetical protein